MSSVKKKFLVPGYLLMSQHSHFSIINNQKQATRNQKLKQTFPTFIQMKNTMKKIIFFSALTFIFMTSCGNPNAGKPAGDSVPAVNTAVKYQCPMKCEGEKAYDTIGKCPVCGMDMQKAK
jgi:Cu2+-exporting ATPase